MEKKKANYTKGTQGYTLVELITVLAIMAILGTMLVSMLDIGVKFYRTENTAMDNQNNARLAIAYITVKIRQNDIVVTGAANGVLANGIKVVSDTVLKINDASSKSGNIFWIYFDSGKLLEHRGVETDFVPDPDNDTKIADLSSFKFIPPYGGPNIQFKASIDGSVDLTQNITLRSSP